MEVLVYIYMAIGIACAIGEFIRTGLRVTCIDISSMGSKPATQNDPHPTRMKMKR